MRLIRMLATTVLLMPHLHAGEVYYTGFGNFATGNDKIVGTDGWIGTSAHLGQGIHGILSEDEHQVIGMGNAAFMGGNNAVIATTNKTVYIRRPVAIDALALGQEVATFSVSFGIKDSSSASPNPSQPSYYRRDSFEFIVFNSSNQQLAGVQFDNATRDTTSIEPGGSSRRLIWRLGWNGTAWQYYNTGYTFLHDTVEILNFRINFRTNRWTATLGGVPLFQDVTFYSGTYAKTLGSVLVQMKVSNTYPFSTNIYPGDNYMLFDDYLVRTDPVTTTLNVSRNGGGAELVWNEEAGYSYLAEYSTDCNIWHALNPVHTAEVTGDAGYTDPTVSGTRFYRIKRSYP